EVRGFSWRINDPKITPSWRRPGCLGSRETFPARVASRELQLRCAAKKSFRAAPQPKPVLAVLAPRWRPGRAPVASSSFRQRNDKSASAKDFLQLAGTSPWARPHKAACVAGSDPQSPAPESRKGRKCARHRSSAAALEQI